MPLRISIFASKDLQRAIAILRGADKEISKEIRGRIRTFTTPEWQEAVRGRTSNAQEVKSLADTARVSVSNQNLTLKSASVGRSLSGGAKPSEIVKAVEFGAPQDTVKTYTATSKKGKRYSVTRHTTRQFRGPSRSGYAVYPAAAQIIPRVAAFIAQTTVRTFHELVEKVSNG